MFLCAIALGFALVRQDTALDAKVTFTCTGLPVPKLVDQLSQAAHVPLIAPKAFQSDIIALRVKDGKLGTLLDKIGDLTAAEWTKKGDVYTLTRSSAKLHTEEVAEYNREVAMLQKGIDKEKKKLALLEPWNDKAARALALGLLDIRKNQGDANTGFDNKIWQRMQDLDSHTPGGRAMTRVLASLQAKDIASLPMDYKIVFSDRPTRMQRPIPSNVLPALRDLISEQNLWSDVSNALIPENEEGGGGFDFMESRKGFHGQIGKVLLMISKARFGGNLNATVELEVADRSGTVVIRANTSLGAFDALEGFADFKEPQAEPGEKPIAPSPFTESMKGVFATPGGPSHKPLPPEIKAILLNPEQNEPLGLSAGDTFVKIAEAKNLNLVACLPDSSLFLAMVSGAQPMTPSMVLKFLNFSGLSLEQNDGWMVLSPVSPTEARSGRNDRAILGTFLRALAKKGRATLDDLAAYATTEQGELFTSLGFVLGSMITGSMQMQFYEHDMLRLYGLLDATQRQMLASGKGLPLGNLTPAQTEVVNKMIFGPNSNLQPQMAPDSENGDDFQDFYNGIRQEPTEIFGQGIPPDSVLKLTGSTDRIITTQNADPAGAATMMMMSQDMSPEEVAQRLYAKERPGIFPWIDGQVPIDQLKFTFGNRRSLNFLFEFGNLAELNKTLQDTAYEPGEPMSYAQLPADFRKAVQDALVEMRKQYADMKPGDIGGVGKVGTTGPPPPPR